MQAELATLGVGRELRGARVIALCTHEHAFGVSAVLYVTRGAGVELAARGEGASLELAVESLRANLRARRAA